MAITFSTSLSQTRVLNSHNNNEVVFTSNSAFTEVSATIEVGGSTFQIYPINNDFYFNFRDVFRSLFTDGFQDTANPTIGATIASATVNGNSIWQEVNVDYTITLSNATTETTTQTYLVLQSVTSYDSISYDEDVFDANFNVLSLPVRNRLYEVDLVYFKGLPFDISFFSETAQNITFTNANNSDTVVVAMVEGVTRLFFCDGITDISDEGFLILETGETNIISGNDENNTTINLEVITPSCSGIYLKWKNNYGGWSYWYFDQTYNRINEARSLGEILRDVGSDGTSTFFDEIGKDKERIINCQTDFLKPEYRRLVASIFESPKVYMYMGDVFDPPFGRMWFPVKVRTNSVFEKQNKNQYDPIRLTIELPKEKTLTL